MNGEKSLHDLAEKIKADPSDLVTTWQKTGSGGKHLIFTYPENCGITVRKGGLIVDDVLYEGIDVRGEGGYIVAAPSNHISGGVYEFYDIPTKNLPNWLLKVLMSQGQENKWINQEIGEGEIADETKYDSLLTRTPLSQREITALTSLLIRAWQTDKNEEEVNHRTMVQAIAVICRRQLVDEKSVMDFIINFDITHKHKDGKIHPPNDLRNIIRDHFARPYKIPIDTDFGFVSALHNIIVDRHKSVYTISKRDMVYGIIYNGMDGKITHETTRINARGEPFVESKTILRFSGIIGPAIKIDGNIPGIKTVLFDTPYVFGLDDAITFFRSRYSLTPTLTQELREILEAFVHTSILNNTAIEYASSPVTVISDVVTVTTHNTDVKKTLNALKEFHPYASHPMAYVSSMAWTLLSPLHDYLKSKSEKGILTPIMLFTGKTRAGKSTLGNLFIGKGFGLGQKEYFYPYERIRTKMSMMKHLSETNLPALFDDVSTSWIADNKEGIKAYVATGTFGDRGRPDQTLTTYRGRRSFIITINDDYSVDTDLALAMRMLIMRFGEQEFKRQDRTRYSKLFDDLDRGFMYDLIAEIFGGVQISEILKDVEAFITPDEWINYGIKKINGLCVKYGIGTFPLYASDSEIFPPQEARIVCETIIEQWHRITGGAEALRSPYPQVGSGEIDVYVLDNTTIVWFTAGAYKKIARTLELTHQNVGDFVANIPENSETSIYRINVSHKFDGTPLKAYAISYYNISADKIA